MGKKSSKEDKYWRRKHNTAYVSIDKAVKHSKAYRSLTALARCLLLEFHEICFPYSRNGDLSIRCTDAAKSLNVSRNTVRRAYSELVAKGFLILTDGARWRNGLTAIYHLTTRPYYVDGRRHEPKDDWKYWRSPADDNNIKIPVPKFGASFE